MAIVAPQLKQLTPHGWPCNACASTTSVACTCVVRLQRRQRPAAQVMQSALQVVEGKPAALEQEPGEEEVSLLTGHLGEDAAATNQGPLLLSLLKVLLAQAGCSGSGWPGGTCLPSPSHLKLRLSLSSMPVCLSAVSYSASLKPQWGFCKPS